MGNGSKRRQSRQTERQRSREAEYHMGLLHRSMSLATVCSALRCAPPPVREGDAPLTPTPTKQQRHGAGLGQGLASPVRKAWSGKGRGGQVTWAPWELCVRTGERRWKTKRRPSLYIGPQRGLSSGLFDADSGQARRCRCSCSRSRDAPAALPRAANAHVSAVGTRAHNPLARKASEGGALRDRPAKTTGRKDVPSTSIGGSRLVRFLSMEGRAYLYNTDSGGTGGESRSMYKYDVRSIRREKKGC